MASNEVPEGEPKTMSFNQYLAALGSNSAMRLVQATGVPPDVIERAEAAKPIPLSSAKLIVQWLGQQFERDIQFKHITELLTVNPGGQPPQGGTNDGNL